MDWYTEFHVNCFLFPRVKDWDFFLIFKSLSFVLNHLSWFLLTVTREHGESAAVQDVLNIDSVVTGYSKHGYHRQTHNPAKIKNLESFKIINQI